MSEAFDRLSDFLDKQMRMSHIYQPAMLIELLQSEGQAHTSEVARAILVRDPTQVEYYENIVRRMPGRVLTQNRGITTKADQTYCLIGYEDLTSDEIDKLITVCVNRIDRFLKERAVTPWSSRGRSRGYISGKTKYEVLKQAGFRCLLCGQSAKVKAIEVDHIVPKSWGGSDDIWNLQALCYSCNASKGRSDDTDLRDVEQSYEYRQEGCTHCETVDTDMLCSNALAYAVTAPQPSSEGKALIVPRRHVSDYFDLYKPELNAIQQVLLASKGHLQEIDELITGFNVSFDSERETGQTIDHCYLQLIPRWSEE